MSARQNDQLSQWWKLILASWGGCKPKFQMMTEIRIESGNRFGLAGVVARGGKELLKTVAFSGT